MKFSLYLDAWRYAKNIGMTSTEFSKRLVKISHQLWELR